MSTEVYKDPSRRCPFCGEIPWTYETKRTKEIRVYCNNKSYKGQPGIVCPLAGRDFSVEEWSYRPQEDMLLERFLRAKKLLQDAIRWIPVGERLPEAYEKVIALAKDCMNVDWVLPKELREVGKGAFARLYNVTHWMPLPKLPEVK